jgi:hypothetical protein
VKDGSQRLKAIKEAGGIAFRAKLDEASCPQMTQNALQHDGRIDSIPAFSVYCWIVLK